MVSVAGVAGGRSGLLAKPAGIDKHELDGPGGRRDWVPLVSIRSALPSFPLSSTLIHHE
jgi:hypothetical protein